MLQEHPTVVVEAIIRLLSYQDQGMNAAHEHVDQELEEKLLVVVANAVVYPGTVVVHSGYTTLTS